MKAITFGEVINPEPYKDKTEAEKKAEELEQTYQGFTYQACIAMHQWTKLQAVELACEQLCEFCGISRTCGHKAEVSQCKEKINFRKQLLKRL